MQKITTLPALCVVSAMLLAEVPAFAQDPAAVPTDAAPPSGREVSILAKETKGSPQKPAEAARDNNTQESLCLMIESAARANELPLEFFARVIWQESRFQSDAVGPVTRSGKRAQGIAQFMPGTASERRLLDPFDPVQALPKSAEFLNELRGQFGNLGLAAAAYNAGPKRVQDWLAGIGAMPQETRNYVFAITGTSVEDWAAAGKNTKISDSAPHTGCRELIALLKRGPNRFVAQLENGVRRAALKLWGVQVAAGFNRDHALAQYALAMKGVSTIIGHQDDPSFQPMLFRSRGTSSFYQVRIGTDRRREADNLCGRIRRAGGACLVKRSRGGTG
jgi:Transglycosylase SLT domain/SPOR domain